MEFVTLVDGPPVSTSIDRTLPRRSLASDAPVVVPPADGDRRLRRRAVHHLLCWWLHGRTRGIPTFDAEGGVARVAESEGEAASHADALLVNRDAYLGDDGDPLDGEAAKLAVDCARLDLVAAGDDPPYDLPDTYGAYDGATLAELVALAGQFEDAAGLCGPGAVFDDAFGLTSELGVDPPLPNVVVGSTDYGGGSVAYTPVLGPDPTVTDRRWRELVGWVLLDDLVSRIDFRHHPPEAELARIDGVDYADPAEQGSVSLATLPIAIARVVRQVLANRDSLGLTSVSHSELERVGVYHAHRGDLQTVAVDAVRGADGYSALFETFVATLLDAADHDGLRRIVDHFLEGINRDG